LEDLFDSNDVPRKPKMELAKSDVQECNIGIDENPKMINDPGGSWWPPAKSTWTPTICSSQHF